MKVISKFRRELSQLNITFPAITAGIGLLVVVIAFIKTANSKFGFAFFALAVRPRFTPPVFLLVGLWGIFFALLCGSFGIILALKCKNCWQNFLWGTLFFVSGILTQILFLSMFFAGHTYFLSLIVIAIACVLAFLLMREFYKISLLATVVAAICEIWLIYNLWLNMCMLILN